MDWTGIIVGFVIGLAIGVKLAYPIAREHWRGKFEEWAGL